MSVNHRHLGGGGARGLGAFNRSCTRTKRINVNSDMRAAQHGAVRTSKDTHASDVPLRPPLGPETSVRYSLREPPLLGRTEACFSLLHQVKKKTEKEGEMQTSPHAVLPSPNLSCDIISQF